MYNAVCNSISVFQYTPGRISPNSEHCNGAKKQMWDHLKSNTRILPRAACYDYYPSYFLTYNRIPSFPLFETVDHWLGKRQSSWCISKTFATHTGVATHTLKSTEALLYTFSHLITRHCVESSQRVVTKYNSKHRRHVDKYQNRPPANYKCDTCNWNSYHQTVI